MNTKNQALRDAREALTLARALMLDHRAYIIEKHGFAPDRLEARIVDFERLYSVALAHRAEHAEAGEAVTKDAARYQWLREQIKTGPLTIAASDGWRSADWMDECRTHLMEHIAKGDPRDVAAYCAFLWHHGESTAGAKPSMHTIADLAAVFDEGAKYGQRASEAPATAGADWRFLSLAAKVRDLLHLLQFADIKCPTEGDTEAAERAMNSIEEFLRTESAAADPEGGILD